MLRPRHRRRRRRFHHLSLRRRHRFLVSRHRHRSILTQFQNMIQCHQLAQVRRTNLSMSVTSNLVLVSRRASPSQLHRQQPRQWVIMPPFRSHQLHLHLVTIIYLLPNNQ
jgi:hypothetical protein